MITLCAMIEEKNIDYGDLRFGAAPDYARINPGDVVVANKKRYKVIAASLFLDGSAEHQFILSTFGTPMEIEGVWEFRSFKEDEKCLKSVFLE